MAQLVYPDAPLGDELAWLQAYWGAKPQRLFWLYGVGSQQARGGHRHPSGQMVLRCVVGSVRGYVQTPQGDQWYWLSEPGQYLLLDAQDWRLMYEFSQDAILLVMAQHTYAQTHYIDVPYRPLALPYTMDRD